ncbi:helix-turn-helix transcriptional regulator [Spirosoma sp. KUDC1026]|uniref:helix-turn-helix transcriptional regulator n=1 Tax=Spirosoma sp. KUDC1026 TaxID=2745947 RepID=UPI00159BBF36|nr:helix-turn-helix transcriptional regulator [Spirosoma sp. KUDC1026]QKZ13966.1 helix-turn-helix domain-containing protein [Spirosoma sp. KUDC1026]
MTINDKIKQILIDKNLTPSYFADEIGVQRSSISHILSGRNRPSFDIIQKIIRRFPDLGYDWIMEDEAEAPAPNQFSAPSYGARSMPNRQSAPGGRDGYANVSNSVPVNQLPGRSPQRTELPPEQPAYSDEEGGGIDRRIERILVFYTDGSFQEYTPAG